MKEQSNEPRQDQIKQTVLKIIHKEGTRNLSIRRLAKETGSSEAAIFRHFASKKEIILSILEDVKSNLLEALRKIALSDESPEERSRLLLCTTVRYMIANQGITILLLSEGWHENDVDVKSDLNLIFHTQRGLMQRIVTDGISKELWDPTLPLNSLTMLYMGIPVSLNMEIVLDRGIFDEDTFCEEMYRLLLKLVK